MAGKRRKVRQAVQKPWMWQKWIPGWFRHVPGVLDLLLRCAGVVVLGLGVMFLWCLAQRTSD